METSKVLNLEFCALTPEEDEELFKDLTAEVFSLCSSLQDYGLDVAAFQGMISECPKRVLDLAAGCCRVRFLLCFFFGFIGFVSPLCDRG